MKTPRSLTALAATCLAGGMSLLLGPGSPAEAQDCDTSCATAEQDQGGCCPPTPQPAAATEEPFVCRKGGLVQSATLGTLRCIPPGTFQMGSSTGAVEAQPVHEVTLTRGFLLMESEVTQEMWEAVMGSNPSEFSACGAACPVESVGWDDIQPFIAEVSRRDGVSYRLPTEAEWEWAAKGGQDFTYAGSEEVDAVAWFSGNSDQSTHPACRKQRNGYGLCDMTGNVWELTADWHGVYLSGAVTDPSGPSSGSWRVGRGGSWFNDASFVRVADRRRIALNGGHGNLGFRLARAIQSGPGP